MGVLELGVNAFAVAFNNASCLAFALFCVHSFAEAFIVSSVVLLFIRSQALSLPVLSSQNLCELRKVSRHRFLGSNCTRVGIRVLHLCELKTTR